MPSVREKKFRVTPKMKKWFMKEIEYLKDKFYLQGWEILIDFMDSDDEEQSGVAAQVTTNWEYRRAQLRVYPRFWKESLKSAREILVHEFIHILTVQPFHLISSLMKGKMVSEDEIHAVGEHMTTWLTSIIIKGMPDRKV